jgi:hypothetical protein
MPGPGLTGLRDTQIMGSISYTPVNKTTHNRSIIGSIMQSMHAKSCVIMGRYYIIAHKTRKNNVEVYLVHKFALRFYKSIDIIKL